MAYQGKRFWPSEGTVADDVLDTATQMEDELLDLPWWDRMDEPLHYVSPAYAAELVEKNKPPF